MSSGRDKVTATVPSAVSIRRLAPPADARPFRRRHISAARSLGGDGPAVGSRRARSVRASPCSARDPVSADGGRRCSGDQLRRSVGSPGQRHGAGVAQLAARAPFRDRHRSSSTRPHSRAVVASIGSPDKRQRPPRSRADSPRQAHRATGTRDQSHCQLREAGTWFRDRRRRAERTRAARRRPQHNGPWTRTVIRSRSR